MEFEEILGNSQKYSWGFEETSWKSVDAGQGGLSGAWYYLLFLREKTFWGMSGDHGGSPDFLLILLNSLRNPMEFRWNLAGFLGIRRNSLGF